MQLGRAVSIVLALGLGIAVIGCTPTSKVNTSTPQDVTFTNGRLHGEVAKPLAKMVQATRLGLQDAKLSITAYRADDKEAFVTAVAPNGIAIEVTLHAKGKDATEILINSANTTNEQAYAEAYNAIYNRAK